MCACNQSKSARAVEGVVKPKHTMPANGKTNKKTKQKKQQQKAQFLGAHSAIITLFLVNNSTSYVAKRY